MWTAIRPFGFIYYNVYTSAAGFPIAWVTRENTSKPYFVFYCDGKYRRFGTRGSVVNAMALANGYVKLYSAAKAA